MGRRHKKTTSSPCKELTILMLHTLWQNIIIARPVGFIPQENLSVVFLFLSCFVCLLLFCFSFFPFVCFVFFLDTFNW